MSTALTFARTNRQAQQSRNWICAPSADDQADAKHSLPDIRSYLRESNEKQDELIAVSPKTIRLADAELEQYLDY
jgi:hypothetical protein